MKFLQMQVENQVKNLVLYMIIAINQRKFV